MISLYVPASNKLYLVKVVRDECINSNTEVVVHIDDGVRETNSKMPLRKDFDSPAVQFYSFSFLCG